MPNVLLTTGCNLACSYCFAREKMRGKPRQVMAIEDVKKVIAFLKSSDCPVFRVMGGEPTLHPQFAEVITLALREGMRVDVLSNATWPDEYNTLFARISPARLLFLINVDHPSNYRPEMWARIERNLASVANRHSVTLSFNIFERQPRYEYVFELAARFGIRQVRLSFSLPVLDTANAHLPLEDYQALAPFVGKFVREGEAHGVRVQLDNAVPLCAFDDAQLGELLRKGVMDLQRNTRCDPVIDIGPDLSVWYCFCLSKLDNRRLGDFEDLRELQQYYRQAVRHIQDEVFPMPACEECPSRSLWGCQGGCLTFSAERANGTRFAHETSEVGALEVAGPAQLTALADDVVVDRYDLPGESFVLRKKTSGVEVEVHASFKQLLDQLDGRCTIESALGRVLGGQSDPSEGPTSLFVREVTRQSLQDLLTGLQRGGFLIERRPDDS